MTTEFIAVVRIGSTAGRSAVRAAGATTVLSWAELATSTEADDAPVVMFDEIPFDAILRFDAGPIDPARFDRSDGLELDRGALAAQVAAVLSTLASVDPLDGLVDGSIGRSIAGSAGTSVPADRDVVIATVRPVIDTLKLVDAAGVLTGTAERDEHRFVRAPIAARLRVLRAVSRELNGTAADSTGPTPVAVLAALVGRGATVLGSSN